MRGFWYILLFPRFCAVSSGSFRQVDLAVATAASFGTFVDSRAELMPFVFDGSAAPGSLGLGDLCGAHAHGGSGFEAVNLETLFLSSRRRRFAALIAQLGGGIYAANTPPDSTFAGAVLAAAFAPHLLDVPVLAGLPICLLQEQLTAAT